MDAIWSLGARYCVRQDAHAFMWLWGLFLMFAGAGFVVGRRGRPFEAVVLAFLAVCTAALGLTIFYACSASAPYSMGLGAPGVSGARLTTFACLGQGASVWTFLWTVVALSCGAGLGLVSVGRSRGKAIALRAISYAGVALLLVVVAVAAFVWFFDFSWCSSQRLF